MGMVVRSNIMAMNANRQLGINNNSVAKNLEKLSSGFKINRAGDDASGLAISEKMKAQIKGLETASSNAQDGISLVQTAEGALTEVHDMLNRMVELATKSANGTIQDAVDREAIQSEVNALNDEIDRISQSTNFNGINLLDGNLGGYATTSTNTSLTATVNGGNLGAKLGKALVVDLGTLTAHGQPSTDIAATDITLGGTALTAGAGHFALTGKSGDGTNGGSLTYTFVIDDKTLLTAEQAEALEGVSISVVHGDITAGASTITVANNATGGGLTLQIGDTGANFNKVTVSVGDMSANGLGTNGLDVSNATSARASIQTIKDAINTVSTNRADMGALQNRLEHTINNLDVAAENMSAANSRIRDTDMAKQMMEYTKMNVLTQAAQAMLAQANQQPQSILQLLR